MIISKLEALQHFWGHGYLNLIYKEISLGCNVLIIGLKLTNINCARKEGELFRDHISQEMKQISGS
jgi:hypothetical protein